MFKKLQYIFLVIIPLLFLLIGFSFDRTRFGTDPESAYLLNGINIAMGRSVGHFDNPGTTVQMYSALVISITHMLRSTDKDLQTDVLLNSEYYIEVLRYSIIALNALVFLVLGFVAAFLLGNLWAGLILQLAPALSVIFLEESFTKVAPEPFLFSAVSVLVMVLLKYYKSQDDRSLKYPLIFGLIAGFGMATKLTFLPVLIIPFIVLTGKRNKWIYVFSILPAFVLFTLPAVTGYPQMAGWFLNLGTHTGTYGQGSSGIIDYSTYFISLASISRNNMAMMAILFAGAVALIFNLKKQAGESGQIKKALFNQLLAVVIAVVISILMVAKHYHSNHYLFPAFSLMGYMLVLIILLVRLKVKGKKQGWTGLLFPAVLAVITGVSLLNVPALSMAYKGYRMSNQSTAETEARLAKEYTDYAKVYYYPVSFNQYASLKWGNVYSRQYNNDKLMELFPEGVFYNTMEKSFQFWETNVTPETLGKRLGNKILLVGGPRSEDEFVQMGNAGFKLNKLFESRVQAVYEIDIINSPVFKNIVQKTNPVWSLGCDFEKVSPDGKSILAADGSDFCTVSSLSADKARSGKNALKLVGFDSYAMDYKIENVKAGDSFEMNIWRYGINKGAFLVVAGGPADPFYQQTDGFFETDAKGWQKIEAEFKIPAGFKGNTIKVYLWNHSKSPVWFDDFTVTKY